MIADLDETIQKLLIAEIPIKNNEIEVSFDQPKREWSARLSKPPVNFFLYDVRENPILRQHQWERLEKVPSGDPLAHLKRTPFRVDCYYMLTTWAAEPDDEHRLLTRCMLALFRYPILPEAYLIGSLKSQPYEIQARLASHDKLTNPAEVWSSLDNEMRPSISYLLTLALDPWKEITGPVVSTLTLRSGQSTTLPHTQNLIPESADGEMTFIGGTVRKGKSDGAPVPGIQVAVKGTGLADTTDQEGHFTLGSLIPGKYTLIAWLPEGKPSEKQIIVPAKDDNYDLVL